MKTARAAVLMALALMAGIFVMRGIVPDAIGQQPDFPRTPAMKPGIFDQNSPQSHSIELAKEYAKATRDDVKKELKKQLSDSLNKEFDQLAQRQQADLDDLEKQVAERKSVLKKRKESRDTIVERRLEQLILDAEGLGWGSPKHADPSSPFGYTKPNNLAPVLPRP
jgi:hypothetical protein